MPEVPLPAISSVGRPLELGRGAVAWAVETFVSPRSWWVYADDDAEPRRTALDTATPIDFAGIEVERVFATSKDGTRIPINLIYRAGTPKDGSAPAVLYGYGGFAISLKPSFEPSRLLWLEHGGVYAVANIRGGGEYGREWHHAGRLATKQNCFDDFAACADHLVQTRVTSRERLGIMGGSNGGLLMGAVLTQRPDIAAAVVSAVPVLDMLRNELTPNGAFVMAEFGSVRDPEQFRVLYAYSPYHNVVDGTAYPPVLFTAGEFDPRVEAYTPRRWPPAYKWPPLRISRYCYASNPAATASASRWTRRSDWSATTTRFSSTAWGCRTARPRSDQRTPRARRRRPLASRDPATARHRE